MSKFFVQVDDEHFFEAEDVMGEERRCSKCYQPLPPRSAGRFKRLYAGSFSDRESASLLVEQSIDRPFGGREDMERMGNEMLAQWRENA
jgi:hypothetical protein